MKLIVAVLCAVSFNAMADTWTMPNHGGGQIVLTDRKCKGYSKLLEAYSYTGKGYWEGCWTVIDGKVHVAWEGNERRVYDISDFKPDEVTPKKKGSAL
jgi:hypothetical protein